MTNFIWLEQQYYVEEEAKANVCYVFSKVFVFCIFICICTQVLWAVHLGGDSHNQQHPQVPLQPSDQVHPTKNQEKNMKCNAI